jgi:hypothetical protein
MCLCVKKSPVVCLQTLVLGAHLVSLIGYENDSAGNFSNDHEILTADWPHIFRCDGAYTASLEGFKNFEIACSRSTESNEEVGNAALTGIAKLTSISGNPVWARLEDGFCIKNKNEYT